MTQKKFSEVIFLLLANSNDKRSFDLIVKQHATALSGVCARSLMYSAIGFALLIYFAPVPASNIVMGNFILVCSVIMLSFGIFHKNNTDGQKRLLILQGALFYGASSLPSDASGVSTVFILVGYFFAAFLMAAIFSATLSARRFFKEIIEQPVYDRTLYNCYTQQLQAESAEEPWYDPLNEMWCNRLPEDEEFELRQKFNDAGRLDDYIDGKMA
tara:strand:+ start:117 stop:758 length:642 start_codon:yes stop_codon:yes gene_type:complete